MAEPQAAAPATAPAAPAPSKGSTALNVAETGIGAILGEIANDGTDEPANDTGEQTEPTEETSETTEQAEPEAPKASDDDVFSAEALSTPEGIEAARARIGELRKKSHEAYLGLKKYEKRLGRRQEKLQASVNEFVANKRNYDITLNNVRNSLATLYGDDPSAAVDALGHLTGKDGVEAVNWLNSSLVNRGKPKLNPQVQAMLDEQKSEIQQLRQMQEERLFHEKKAQVSHQIEGHKQAIAQLITSDQQLPHLARVFNDDPERVTQLVIDEITKVNGQIPAKVLFQRMEQELASHFGGAPRGDGGGGNTQNRPLTQGAEITRTVDRTQSGSGLESSRAHRSRVPSSARKRLVVLASPGTQR